MDAAAINGGILRSCKPDRVAESSTSLVQSATTSATQTQIGGGDTQSIVQTGAGNNASYIQIGSNLPDLGVTQTGGMSVSILQTGPGH